MIKKNLFIVASPLQLLNALESQETFKTTNNILLLIYNSNLNATDLSQKKSLINIKKWNEIIYYDLGLIAKKKRFFEQVKLIKKLKFFHYNYLFSGDFGTIQQAIMANISVNEIYLLDDGTASIFTYEKLRNKNYFQSIPFSGKLKLFRYTLAGLKYKIHKDINFFTIYDIQALPHMKVVKHGFSYLKSTKLQECKNDNNIYLLGQNIAEVHWITKEKYLKYLEKIIAKFKGRIIYKPHRSEEITKEYDCLLCDNFIIDKEISQGPIETSLIDNGIYPKMIISFFSSALFSLDKIFSDSEIYAIKIDKNDLVANQDNIAIVDECYNFFRNTGVNILKL